MIPNTASNIIKAFTNLEMRSKFDSFNKQIKHEFHSVNGLMNPEDGEITHVDTHGKVKYLEFDCEEVYQPSLTD